jgi:hypothetical protein
VRLPLLAGIGRRGGEAGVGGEALGAGGVADQSGRVQRAAAGLGEHPGTLLAHAGVQLGVERVGLTGECSYPSHQLAGDAYARAGGQAPQRAGDAITLIKSRR